MVCVLLLHAELTPPCRVRLEPSCSTTSAGAPLASALTKCVVMGAMGRASTRMAACNVINVYGAGGEKGDAIRRSDSSSLRTCLTAVGVCQLDNQSRY